MALGWHPTSREGMELQRHGVFDAAWMRTSLCVRRVAGEAGLQVGHRMSHLRRYAPPDERSRRCFPRPLLLRCSVLNPCLR